MLRPDVQTVQSALSRIPPSTNRPPAETAQVTIAKKWNILLFFITYKHTKYIQMWIKKIMVN